VDLLNPEWKTTDMAVFRWLQEGDFYRVDFGDRQADRHAIFKRIDKDYELIDGGKMAVSCEVIERHGMPIKISGRSEAACQIAQ
jgi:hypothetical protein